VPGFFTRCKEITVATVQIVKVVEILIVALRRSHKRGENAGRGRNSETGIEVRRQRTGGSKF
jgi:hypothetical protein